MTLPNASELAPRLPFADRRMAGRALGQAVARLELPEPIIVLALPRGGVPIAAEVASSLGAPLDLLIVRKIGVPWQPELAVGALAEGRLDRPWIDESARRALGVSDEQIARQVSLEIGELARRQRVYRPGRAGLPVRGASVVLVDDGIATGATVHAALAALRAQHPGRIVLAVPVAPAQALSALRSEVDDIVCLAQPEPFYAVGSHYENFEQVSDEAVLNALYASATQPWPGTRSTAGLPGANPSPY
jgi:putative phosphoribosyl transferase